MLNKTGNQGLDKRLKIEETRHKFLNKEFSSKSAGYLSLDKDPIV